ncbi:MAG TPA: sugar ABC transporter substrate-binding protein [Ktedonosporobacter sp.]|nr:sugar ABC transporter substrate-binding protein [Ktedonosporobacter sp.]
MITSKTIKTTIVLLLAVLMMIGTAACDSASPASTTGNQKVTVTLMTWEGDSTNALIDAAMKKFMAQNPDIIVQRIPSPNSDYGTKLTSLVVAKKLPDLFWAGNDTEQQYGAQGLLYDYTNLAGSATGGFDLSKFAPASIDNWKNNGHLFGLPSLMNTYGVWYNADLFQAAGLPLPKAGWTYQEMLHDAQVLTQKNGNTVSRYGLVAPPDDPFAISNYSVSAGGAPFEDKILNPTSVTASPQFIEGTKLFANAVQNGSVTPPGYATDNVQASFAAGKIPMLYFGQWLAAGFLQSKPSFKYGFAPLPVVKDSVQPYDAVGIASPSYIQHPDAVWKVMQYLDTTAWESILPGSPVAPAAYVPSSTPYFDTLKSDGLTTVADSVQYELTAQNKLGIRFVAPWSTKANDIITANWDGILLGKTPTDSGVQTMVQQLNDVIKQNS